MIPMLASLVLFVLVLAPVTVWADDITITFNDLTESPTVTFSPAGQTRATGSCILESCTVTVLPPAGTLFGIAISPSSASIGDPDGVTISDTFDATASVVTAIVSLTFTSDGDVPGGLGLCADAVAAGGCFIIENGAIQQIGTISWFGSGIILATDTIQFASDIDSQAALVSGASSLLLFMLGLPFLARATRGGRCASRFRLTDVDERSVP